MSLINIPLNIKNYTLKNRIVMPPMCMYQAKDGFANEFHYIHYATRAIGGVGLIIVEATAVSPEGVISINDLGIWNDRHIEGLSKIASLIKNNGSNAGIQINHAGRKAKLNQVYAPSPIAFGDYIMPVELTKEKIKEIIASFKDAAIRADKAGFDFLEIHAAHGYLIHQFISPLSNKRNDEYKAGTKFLEDVLEGVRSVWPKDKVLQIRFSTNEYDENGLSVIDYVDIINSIKKYGVDIVNVSSGGIVLKTINAYPGYQLNDAKIIKEKTGLKVIGGGLISKINEIEDALKTIDLVYTGRLLLRDPYFVSRHFEEYILKPYERSKTK